MNKKQNGFALLMLLALIVLVFTVGYVVIRTNQSNNSKSAIYENKSLGFKFSYPKTWSLVVENNRPSKSSQSQAISDPSQGITATYQDGTIYGQIQTIDIQVQPIESESHPIDFYLSKDHYFITDNSAISVGGVAAAQYRWQDTQYDSKTQPGQPYIGTIFENKKYVFNINYSYPTEVDKQKHISEYNKLIESFTFE